MHGADVCTLLKGDNEKLRELVDELEETEDPEGRKDRVRALEHELDIHRRVAEEIFYPEVKKTIAEPDGRLFVQQATEDHRLADRAFDALRSAAPSSREFTARLDVLKALIARHADEEEVVFHRVRDEMDTEAMQKMGDRVNQRRLELEKLYPGGRAEHLGAARGR